VHKKAAFSALVVASLALFLPELEGGSAPARPRHASEAIAAETVERVSVEKQKPPPGRVVLVVIDGVRWQDVFGGADPELARTYLIPQREVLGVEALVPNLHRLATGEGLAYGMPQIGEAMFASGPNYVSQPGYIEIFSERRPIDCLSNYCPKTTEPTFVDAIAEATNGSAAVISSWEVVGRAAASVPHRLVLSAGQAPGENQSELRVNAKAAHALEMGRIAAAWPGHGEYRPDKYTREIALEYLEARHPRFLFLGLGDTDEYAHLGDYRGYLRALHDADATVGTLLETLERMGEDGRNTTVLVTTDHGRERAFMSHGGFAPESSRVWMIAGGNVRPDGPVALPKPAHLFDVGPTVRELMGLAHGQGEGRALVDPHHGNPSALSLAKDPPNGERAD
jgi:hypothetical protein